MYASAIRRTTFVGTAALVSAALLSSAAPAAFADDSFIGQAALSASVVEKATGTADLAPFAASSVSGVAAQATVKAGKVTATVTAPAASDGQVKATATASTGGTSFSLGLPKTKDVKGVKAGSGTVVYTGAAKSTDIAVQPTASGGVRTLVTLKDASAPTTQRFSLHLPAGAELVADGNGGYEVVQKAGEDAVITVGTIEAPWAKDANGKAVHTEYKLDGTELIQTVETNDKTAFPVVADPKWTWGWVSGTVYFNKRETKHMSGNAAFVGAAFAFAPPPFDVYGVLNAANIARVANNAASDGKCVEVKVPTFLPYTYKGGYCK